MTIVIHNKYGEHKLLLESSDLLHIQNKKVRVMCEKGTGVVRSVLVSKKGEKNGKILSRLILNPPKGLVIDHINKNPLDNRKKNLRICTQRENTRNKTIQKNNTSGVPSVEWQKDCSMWRVRPKFMGTKIQIGYFKDKNEAIYVRDQVILQLHGKFAKTYIL